MLRLFIVTTARCFRRVFRRVVGSLEGGIAAGERGKKYTFAPARFAIWPPRFFLRGISGRPGVTGVESRQAALFAIKGSQI